ncbi:MAG: winged helix-turn-helix domain-containing protein, partial [Gammaproteobacteria bacterium]
MSEKIGSAAGKIWNYLDKHQTASVAKLTDATSLSKNDIQRALG